MGQTGTFLALLALAGPVLQAAVLRVGREGAFRTIQDAIRSAAPRDTILVEAGTYHGNLVLDKPLVLEGQSRPVIRGDGKGSAITVTAAGCTVRGFAIEHSGAMLVDEDSGILLKSNGNRIEHNDLRDVLFGIYFLNSSHNVVTGNVIRGRPLRELGDRGSGIHIWNSSDNTIEGNRISQVRDGMYFQNAYRTSVRGNRVHDLRYGLHYMFSDDNVFEDNSFYDNVAGAAIMYSRRIQFRRNSFVRNRGFSSFGILFQDSDDCLAEHNVIVDNVVGIFMEALRTSVFRLNLIAANDIAVRTFSSASENVFERNNFIDNLSPLQIIGKTAGAQWNTPAAGNHWSEYEGYDLNGDGIGDVPLKIQNLFEHLEGNYPRLRLYLFSPASQALAAAEKALPVIEGSKEFDHRPLTRPVALAINVSDPAGGPAQARFSLALPALMLAVSVVVMARGRRR